jgi:hypothetical protein
MATTDKRTVQLSPTQVVVNKRKLEELLNLVAFPKNDKDSKRAQSRAATMLKQL